MAKNQQNPEGAIAFEWGFSLVRAFPIRCRRQDVGILCVSMIGDNPDRPEKSPLRQFREQHQLTQFQLRRLIGVSERRLSDWETGKARPNLENAVALARVYQVPLKVICQCCGVDVTGVPDDLSPQPNGDRTPSTRTPTH